jgi:predicted RNA-binding Zn-ribbon protein involved in translation (DUF1610 family)
MRDVIIRYFRQECSMPERIAESWQIEHRCPQCGAPVVLYETDRLFACPFCRTKLYLYTNASFRYSIQTQHALQYDLIYVPYWRLKGLSFTVAGREMTSRFFDTSRLAVNMPNLLLSLGFRPQTLKLKFASPETGGRFLEPALDKRMAIQTFAANAPSLDYQAFIGEMLSLIYAPMYIENNTLYDAVLERAVCPLQDGGADLSFVTPSSQSWPIHFLPTLCPHCGWDLQGSRDAIVLLCPNCNTAWSCKNGAFEKVPFAVWRITPMIDGVCLNTYADLIRLGNLPKVVTEKLEQAPLYFWSPAFKLNPVHFLQWSRQMTFCQFTGSSHDLLPKANCHPVTLPPEEACESIVITLASLASDKRKVYPLLPDIRVLVKEIILEFHPFKVSGNELIHDPLNLRMDKNAVAFGTGM